MSDQNTEVRPPIENRALEVSKKPFLGGRITRNNAIAIGIALIAIVGVGTYLVLNKSNSTPTATLNTQTPPVTSTTPASITTTTNNAGSNSQQIYGSKDPFVSLESPSTTAVFTTTTVAGTVGTTSTGVTSTTLVTPSTTSSSIPSQLVLVSVSPVGQPPTAEVTVNGITFPGLTPGQSFAGSFVITAINQSTGCSTFTNSGANPFQICLNQAVTK